MQLDDEISNKIDKLAEQGSLLLDESGEPLAAIEVWQEALELLPEPKADWEAATWLNASIGEAYFVEDQKDNALAYLMNALNCPDGHMNPFILLRIGQILVDKGQTDAGIEYLLRAYMLDGTEVFEEDSTQYLDLLKKRNLIT